MATATNDRFFRQQDLVPAERLAELFVTVIGVGSIGRQVARTLAAIGVRRLQLVDFDQVENGNRTTQGYLLDDVGKAKVVAMAQEIARFDPSIAVELVEDRYRPKLIVGEAVFCCVDSIETRGAIWRSIGPRTKFWADGRMLAAAIRILVAADEVGRRHYPTTIFSASEAHPGSCTASNTFDTAEIAAGLMVHQFIRWLRGQRVDADISLNLLASELVVSGGANQRDFSFVNDAALRKDMHHGDCPAPRRAVAFFYLDKQSEEKMSQRDLNEMVARATGESLRVVDQLGFHLADPFDANYDPEPRRPLVFDWDSRSPADWPER